MGILFNASQEREHVEPLLDGVDAVHLHGAWDPTNLSISRVANRMGVPYFVSVRGMLDDWVMAKKGLKKRTYLALCGRRWLEGARAVHFTAGLEREESRKHFPKGRSLVIPNLLNLADFEDLPGPEPARERFGLDPEGAPVVLTLSRMHPIKQLEILIEASAILKRDGLPIRLVIAGAGDDRYVSTLKKLAADLGLAGPDIAFVGQVLGREKLSLYQAADLFAMTSAHENFGFSIAEALACATPVLVTPGIKIRDELTSGGGGFVAPEQAKPFAAEMRRLLETQDLTETGRRGREWVGQWLDTDRLIAEFEHMYSLPPEDAS